MTGDGPRLKIFWLAEVVVVQLPRLLILLAVEVYPRAFRYPDEGLGLPDRAKVVHKSIVKEV